MEHGIGTDACIQYIPFKPSERYFSSPRVHVCTWTPHAKTLLKSCCGDYRRIEPLKPIWLPGLEAHLWIATVVMWLDTFAHPWHFDEGAAACMLLIMAMIFTFKRKLNEL